VAAHAHLGVWPVQEGNVLATCGRGLCVMKTSRAGTAPLPPENTVV
jgi:hypothetical protein